MSVKKDSYNEYMSKRGSYAIIPNEIWERKDLDHTAKVIWCYLVSRNPDWNSSRNNIARNLGMGVNTVSRYIEQLQEANLLRVRKGSLGAWNFEITNPSLWVPSESESKEIRIQSGFGTESAVDPLLNPPEIHTQEAISNKQLAGELSGSQETRDVAPADALGVQRKANSSQAPGNDNITPSGILISWRKQYPQGPGFLSGKRAASALNELFFNLQRYGFQSNEITNNQIIRFVFGPKPKSNLRAWIEDIESQIDLQRSSVFEKAVEIEAAPGVDDLSQLNSPEAVAKYRQYKAEGRTPADFNGMSLVDYANMRAYAESFRSIT